MKLVVFGLSVSSSWGNGHATLWRGLIRALAAQGNRVVFFEEDVPYYALNRDLHAIPGGDLVLYPDWDAASARARPSPMPLDAPVTSATRPDRSGRSLTPPPRDRQEPERTSTGVATRRIASTPRTLSLQ